MTPMASTTSPCHFLGLPGELREAIYVEVFKGNIRNINCSKNDAHTSDPSQRNVNTGIQTTPRFSVRNINAVTQMTPRFNVRNIGTGTQTTPRFNVPNINIGIQTTPRFTVRNIDSANKHGEPLVAHQLHPSMSMLMTSKQVYEEAILLFYKHTTFYCTGPQAALRFLKAIPEQCRTSIENVLIYPEDTYSTTAQQAVAALKPAYQELEQGGMELRQGVICASWYEGVGRFSWVSGTF